MDLSNNTPYLQNQTAVDHMHILSSAMANLNLNENPMCPADIQRQIESQQINHAAFMLGRGIRYVWDTTAQFLSNIYSSYKSTRASHFINEEDFDYKVHQNINAETCVEGYEEQCEKGYPQAIVLSANYFRDSYGFEKILDKLFVEQSRRHQIFLNTLAKNHRVHNLVISNDQDMCEIIRKAHQLGPIRFLYLFAHGEGASIAMSSKNNDFRKDNIDIYDYYYQNQGNQDLSCLELMDEDSVIILMSCNTANEVMLNINNNSHTFPASIQKLFALHAPQSKVFAADFYALKNSIVIKYDTNSKMQVYIQGNDSESTLHGALDFVKTLIHWLTWFSYDLNNPYLNELFLLKPLKEISKEKAEFCREVIPYFAMKRFCDKAKIQPSKKSMKKCISEPKCEEATQVLDYIQESTKNQCKR